MMKKLFSLLQPRIQNGQILITLVVVIPAIVVIVSAYLSLNAGGYRLERSDQFRTQAQMAADAGADYAIEQINQNASWAGTGGEVTLQSDSVHKVTYAVTVTNDSSSSKTLGITGRTYFPATAATAAETVKINVSLREITSGLFSVASGEGGLKMNNSSKITGGDVYINGTITMSNTAQIGLSTSPVNVFVADDACPSPPDSTYPRLCTAADHPAQPISMSNTPWIYGNVQANNQTSTSRMSNPGLTASSGVSTVALPTYDRNSQKAAVTTTLPSGFSCSSGTQTWAANTKIVGDVALSNSCIVKVDGNVWITGALSIKNSAQLNVDDSVGSTSPVIMVDGSSGVSLSNTATLGSNSSGTGLEIITFYSTASCSPDCSSVTGTDLYNSQSVTTISLDNNVQAPQTILYAYWSTVLIKNSGQIGALIGQTVNLQNTGTITFTSSTGTGTSSWIFNGYRQAF